LKSIPEQKRLLVTGFTRGGLRSRIYTTSAFVLLAGVAIGDYPHLNPIIPAFFLLLFVWTVFMIDLGQKVRTRETRNVTTLADLPLTEVGIPVEPADHVLHVHDGAIPYGRLFARLASNRKRSA